MKKQTPTNGPRLSPQRQRDEEPEQPTLRFSVRAWAKLLYLRDRSECEVGGFGIAATEDPLLITDIALVKQNVSPVSVKFDDEGVADHLDRFVDAGLSPAQCLRVWIHTHPGRCPEPSHVDEQCFARVFGSSDWALMVIVSRTGEVYARLRFNVGPGGEAELPVEVDFSQPFAGSDQEAWAEEYDVNVTQQPLRLPASLRSTVHVDDEEPWDDDWPELEAGCDDEADLWWWEMDEEVADVE